MLVDKFVIHGKKDIYIEKLNDNYVLYDPIALEYHNINEIGANILYYLSQNLSLPMIVQTLQESYEVDYEECKAAVLEFLEEIPIRYIIYHNLIQTDIYLELPPFLGGK